MSAETIVPFSFAACATRPAGNNRGPAGQSIGDEPGEAPDARGRKADQQGRGVLAVHPRELGQVAVFTSKDGYPGRVNKHLYKSVVICGGSAILGGTEVLA